MNPIKIDVNQSVTSRLSFEPTPEYNNLCLGYLKEVRFEETESDSTAKWEFAGMTVPRIVFEFEQLKDQYNNRDRYYVHSELPVTITKSNGEERKETDIVRSYTEMWRRLKHIHDAYAKSANFSPINENPEFDPSLPEGERLDQIKAFFKYMAKAFNVGKDKETPIFEPNGGDKRTNLVAMKLIATGQKGNRLAFPTFVGKGFIEPAAFTNSKLDVTLKFGPNETVQLGQVSMPSGSGSNAAEEIGDDIKNLIR